MKWSRRPSTLSRMASAATVEPTRVGLEVVELDAHPDRRLARRAGVRRRRPPSPPRTAPRPGGGEDGDVTGANAMAVSSSPTVSLISARAPGSTATADQDRSPSASRVCRPDSRLVRQPDVRGCTCTSASRCTFQNPQRRPERRGGVPPRARLRPPGRDVGVRLDLDGRAPLHRVHDVPGPAAAADLPGRPDPPHPARHRGHRAALARSRSGWPSRSPCSTTCPVGGCCSASAGASPRSSTTASGCRWTPHASASSSTPSVAAARPGGRLRRARRRVHLSSPAASSAPAAAALLPRPHLRRRGLAGLHADHGRARRRAAGHRPEAVGDGAGGLRRVPGDVGRGQRG